MLSFHTADVTQLQKLISDTIINTIKQVNSSPRNHHQGVWYDDDYAEYCANTNIKFDIDLMNGFANPEYWVRTDYYTFQLKNGANPSTAINAFINDFTIADCGNILVVSEYLALLQVFGKEKFDLLFSSNCSPLVIGQFLYDKKPINPIFHFFCKGNSRPSGQVGNRPINVGEFCYIEGIIFYPDKHPAGAFAGFNLSCVGKNEQGEDLFIGFGPNTFKEKPLTERELFVLYFHYYNLEQNEFDKKASENLHLCYPDNISDDHYGLIGGFLSSSVVKPNFKIINQYISVPSSKIITHHYHSLNQYHYPTPPQQKSNNPHFLFNQTSIPKVTPAKTNQNPHFSPQNLLSNNTCGK